MAENKKLLIIGGGFAGVKTARSLANNSELEITLITDQETFRYGATIWRAAVGYLKEMSYIPVASLLPKNVTLIHDSAASIDRNAQKVKTKSGKTHTYDYCVIALGTVTSYFGIAGLDKFSYGVKSSAEFDAFREHLHQEVINENALDTNYVVVGAGPTGVELAAALKGYLKQVAKHHKIKRSRVNLQIVEAAPKILPMLRPKASRKTHQRLRKLGIDIRTKTAVKGESENSLLVGEESVPTHTVVWTAGMTNNPFFAANPSQFELNERKKVVVDENLRVDTRTFVIGDNAATPFSGLALTALHNAEYVAKVIENDLRGQKTAAYKPLKPITIIPVGEDWAVLQWRKLVMSGRFTSFLRTVYDFIGYSEIMGMRGAAKVWFRRNTIHEDCPFCKDTK